MGRVLVVCAIVVAAIGCRNQTAAITNPFLQPDRVPPPATRLPAPGGAAPYYGADPSLPGATTFAPAPAAAPTYGQPAYAQPTYSQPTSPQPSYSPTGAPPANAYPGSAYPLTPTTPGAAPTVPPGGWGGYQPQSSMDPLVPASGGVLQRLQPREITPAEYQQNPPSQFFGSTPASTLAATTPTASDGFRPQGSTPISPASTATPSPTSLAFRQGLAGGSDESTSVRFARSENYEWLRGQLEYWPETGQWSLRYTDAGAPADGFGGRMAIENPQVLGNLPPGEFVKLRGQMYQRDNGDSTWAPAYRVATVERQRK